MNTACLMKLGWELRTGSDALWCKVLYVANMRGVVWSMTRLWLKQMILLFGNFWRTSWPELSKHQLWSIGNGVSVDPWTSCWLKEGYRVVDMVEDIPLEWRNIKVKGLVSNDGNWIHECINWLPYSMCDVIETVLPLAEDLGEDKWLWSETGGGEYTVSIAYRLMNNEDGTAEVYEWMNNRPERFRISESDIAIQLDLIAKVHGVSSAEEYFLNLTDNFKDKRTYSALLNAYVRSRSKEKAESLLDVMRSKRYLIDALPFNLMMTHYMNFKDYDKVDMMVSEMKENNIQLDIYTYNIWLTSQESVEKMEQVFEQMSKDPTIIPNWSTFSIMATMYIKMELFEKAHGCLKEFESRILGRDRLPFHYLLSLYGNIGMKDEVYRVWNNYKSMFPSIPTFGYHPVISSLVRMDEIEGAEKLYEEWVSVRPFDDSRVSNLIIGWYLKNGKLDKAFNFFEHMIEGGGSPNSTTWEIFAEAHIAEKRISDALSCLKKAFVVTSDSTNWKPKPVKLAAFLKLCRDEGDIESAKVLIELLRQSGYHKDEVYASLIGKYELSSTIERIDDTVDSENMDDDDDSQVLFNQELTHLMHVMIVI
ncbi:hypothetical protein TSUD_353000 [Trifolium subterraneum]|nr:hypothetical protein TSUD_353000 [Trifolium subterraneum]